MFFKGRLLTVDIGTSTLKAAFFISRGKEIKLLATGMKPLPAGVISRGLINDPGIVADRLKEVLYEIKKTSNSNLLAAKLITTIPGQHVVIRNFEFPQMLKSELEEALKWEAEDLINYPMKEAVVKHLVHRGKNNWQVVLIVVKEEVIENYLAPFRLIKRLPAVINIEPLALISLLHYQGFSSQPVVIVDLGTSSSRITIGDSQNIYLWRVIPYEQPGQIKNLKPANNRFSLTENQEINKLLEEISRSLDFYSINHRGREINHLLLTGGLTNRAELIEIISSRLNLMVTALDPYFGLKIEKKKQLHQEQLAVAIGLGVSEVLADES